MNRYFVILIFILIVFTESKSQSFRGLINDGVYLYENKKYPDSEINFRKGLEKNKRSFEAKFNLGDALYKQQRFDEAAKYFEEATNYSKTDEQKASSFYNLGNALLKNQKIEESINAYKNSLKINPNDKEAKFNLSYALNLLKNKNQQKNNFNKNDQKNDDKQNKNKDNQTKQNQNQDKQQQEQSKQNEKLKKDEVERILEALKRNQKDIQKELRKKKAQKVFTEKDW